MVLLRLLLTTLCAAAGLVVFTQVPAAACSCAVSDTAQHVSDADVIFVGTLTEIEQTSPGGDDVISSGDPVHYTFDVAQVLKGSAGDGVVTSARESATCGLAGMRLDASYVVFAGEGEDGALDASLCGGTSPATQAKVGEVEAALSPATEPPTPTATEVPSPGPPIPTQVPSGAEPTPSEDGAPAWAWFAGGMLIAVLGVAAARPKFR